MRKWKKERNYKRIRDKNGNVVANIITVFGKDVVVSNEVFDVYSAMDRRARYITDDASHNKEVSLERLYEDGIYLEQIIREQIIREQIISPEDCCIAKEQQQLEAERLHRLPCAISALSESDQQLIHALFFAGMSTRAYARSIGVSQRTVIKRRDRILTTLKNILEKV
ncbi:sigma-70 RNA polymerase sigma factor region 4 domain-containing protein [Agathobaculum desmolans]|uniref:sigma-70 family RNA polymerase sigma factor n=1 Tax=Agathobaculum desmolans TaxID=39484 RepID=UPI0004E1EB89|nr:sigma-70 family RNA polymerase sigma factor [Agathobaculum desmolans]